MAFARRLLALGYVYPAGLLLLASASLILANRVYQEQLANGACGPTSAIGCVDVVPYYVAEAGVFAATAFLAYRATARARRGGRDAWMLRVYWPILLTIGGTASLASYAYVVYPVRGCDVGLAYALWGCWDPGVTLLRVALAFLLTAGFMLLVTRAPDRGARPLRTRPGKGDRGSKAETAEEIPSR